MLRVNSRDISPAAVGFQAVKIISFCTGGTSYFKSIGFRPTYPLEIVCSIYKKNLRIKTPSEV